MIDRTEKGNLKLKSLDLEIFFGELYEKCNKESEIDWLQEQLTSMVECAAEERKEEI